MLAMPFEPCRNQSPNAVSHEKFSIFKIGERQHGFRRRPSARSRARSVPGKRPQASGGVRSVSPHGRKTLVRAPSQISPRSF
jgi:hypothetical protein